MTTFALSIFLINVYNPLSSLFDITNGFPNGRVASFVGTKAMATLVKGGFIDGFEQLPEGFVHDPVHDIGYS